MTVSFRRYAEQLKSNGVQSHKDTLFRVNRTAERWQSLLTYLEEQAEESKHFNEIAELTSHVLEIRAQLRGQGF